MFFKWFDKIFIIKGSCIWHSGEFLRRRRDKKIFFFPGHKLSEVEKKK